MAPPANDNWANATELTGLSGSLTGQQTIEATTEAGEPAAYSGTADDTIWYKITPTVNALVTVDTSGSLPGAYDTSSDTVLGVYTGSAVNALTLVAGNDDNYDDNYQSLVSWTATAGTTYYIRLHTYTGSAITDPAQDLHVNWLVEEIIPDPPRILFSDCDTLRHTSTWPGSQTDPAGWVQNPNFDDSSWNLIRNGAGNTGPDAPTPDGRVLNEWGTDPSALGYNHWWSEIPNEGGTGVYEGHNYFRFTVDLTQDDLDNGVYLWAGCDYEGTVYCNGMHISIPRTAWNFTSVCQVGTNVFAFTVSDFAYPPPEPGYSYEAHEQAQDGLALDTWFWVHLQTGATPIAPDCTECVELQETITDFSMTTPYQTWQQVGTIDGSTFGLSEDTYSWLLNSGTYCLTADGTRLVMPYGDPAFSGPPYKAALFSYPDLTLVDIDAFDFSVRHTKQRHRVCAQPFGIGNSEIITVGATDTAIELTHWTAGGGHTVLATLPSTGPEALDFVWDPVNARGTARLSVGGVWGWYHVTTSGFTLIATIRRGPYPTRNHQYHYAYQLVSGSTFRLLRYELSSGNLETGDQFTAANEFVDLNQYMPVLPGAGLPPDGDGASWRQTYFSDIWWPYPPTVAGEQRSVAAVHPVGAISNRLFFWTSDFTESGFIQGTGSDPNVDLIVYRHTLVDTPITPYIYQYLDKGNGDYLIVTDEDIRNPDGSVWAKPPTTFGKTMVYLPDEDAVVYSVYTNPGTQLYKITEGGTPTLFGDNPGSGNYSAMSAEGVWQNPVTGDFWCATGIMLWFVWDSEGNWVAEYNNDSTRPYQTTPEAFSFAFDGEYVYAGAYLGIFRARIDDWVATPNDPHPTSRELDFEWILEYDIPLSGGIYGIQYHCGYLYFSHDDGELRRWPVDGTASDVEVLAGGGASTFFPWGVTVAEIGGLPYLFYTDYPASRLHRMGICTTCDGCWNWEDLGALPESADFGVVTGELAGTSLGSKESVYSLGFPPVSVTSDGTDLFIGSTDNLQGDVYRIASLASPSSHAVFADFGDAEHVAYFGGELYAVEYKTALTEGIYKVNLSTGAATLWADGVQVSPFPVYNIAYRPSDGHIFGITLWDGSAVFEFDTSGTLINTFDAGSGGFYACDWDDINDVLVISDQGGANGRVRTLDPTTGTFTTILDVATSSLNGDGFPGEDIVVASNGRVYHADRLYGQIWSHDLNGGDIVIDVPFTSGTVDSPTGITQIGDYLYVADYGNNEIVRFEIITSPTGRVVFYSMDADQHIRSASYPDLASLDVNWDGVSYYTYNVDINPTVDGSRWVRGLTLGPSSELYVLVEKDHGTLALTGGELWEFDTANPSDPGTILEFYTDDAGGLGTMRGHMAYNPVDDRIYVADAYATASGTRLLSIDRTTWTRTVHFTFTLNGLAAPITITPDGGVWYITRDTSTSPTTYWINRYDPLTDTTVQGPSVNYVDVSQDPLALPDNSVLFVHDADGLVYRCTFNGTSITESLDDLRAIDPSLGPFWSGAYSNGSEGWVFDYDYHLWTYNTDCDTGCIGCWYVGMVGIIAL